MEVPHLVPGTPVVLAGLKTATYNGLRARTLSSLSEGRYSVLVDLPGGHRKRISLKPENLTKFIPEGVPGDIKDRYPTGFDEPPVLTAARAAKQKGNTLFQADDFGGAANAYTEALASLAALQRQHLQAVDGALDLRAACFANRAQCWVRLGNWTEAMDDCHVVIGLGQTGRVKPALMKKVVVRLINALEGCGDLQGAMCQVQTALERDKQNTELKEKESHLLSKGAARYPAFDAGTAALLVRSAIGPIIQGLVQGANISANGALQPYTSGDLHPDMRDEQHVNLIFLACEVASMVGEARALPLVRQLSELGASVQCRYQECRTALMVCGNKGVVDVARHLLENGATVNAEDAGGFTALLTAASSEAGCTVPMIQLLLDHGASVHASTHAGYTALIYAAKLDRVDVVNLLLSKGAHVMARDRHFGFTAYTTAWKLHPTGQVVPRLMEAAVKHLTLATEMEEDRQILEWLDFVDELVSANNSTIARLRAAGTDLATQAAVLECELAIVAKLLEKCGRGSEAQAVLGCGASGGGAMVQVAGNPLQEIYEYVQLRCPPVLLERQQCWEEVVLIAADERRQGQLRMLGGGKGALAESRVQPLMDLMYFNWEAGSWVPKQFKSQYIERITQPVAHTFSFAIPNEQAVAAIKALGKGVLEVGAGSGYWARMLLNAGVDVVAYDLHPPSSQCLEEGNQYHAAQYAPVLPMGSGGVEAVLERHRERVLMLVWPYSGSVRDATGRYRVEEEWDAECVLNYSGDVLVYVGEWSTWGGGSTLEAGQEGRGITSSGPFQDAVEAGFVIDKKVDIPSWGHIRDELMIWKRK